MAQGLVDRYVLGGAALRGGVAGLTREQLLASPVPGRMSVQALAMHMLDADLAYADRFKRVAALDRPRLLGWDQDAFARSLAYEAADAHLAAEVFESHRRLVGAMLRALPDEAFAREGVLEGKTTRFGAADGPVTLQRLVEIACEHVDHHMVFMRAKRAALGVANG